jgi:phosphoribosylformimino-5-aminoimidazole carboxamide ribotide isomerase
VKIILAIDLMEGKVVRLVKGDPANKTIYSDSPLEIAKRWEKSGADMIHVVDLDAALQTGRNNIGIISEIIKAAELPVQVAGGIRSIEAVNEMFQMGASRVVLGTLAYKDPSAVAGLVRKNGGRKEKARKIVISIDQIAGNVMVGGWKESTSVKVSDAISRFMSLGINEFLLTSIEKDGTLQGPDVASLSIAVTAGGKVIASGGISSLQDVIIVKNIGCSSVILGKAIYEGMLSIDRAKAIV